MLRLDDLQKLAHQIPHYLRQGGSIVLEHGADQAEAVSTLLSAEGFKQIESHCDYQNVF